MKRFVYDQIEPYISEYGWDHCDDRLFRKDGYEIFIYPDVGLELVIRGEDGADEVVLEQETPQNEMLAPKDVALMQYILKNAERIVLRYKNEN